MCLILPISGHLLEVCWKSVGSQTPYNKTPSGEAYLYVSKSRVVGVGNADTGLGLFTYEDIPKNTYVCSYAPTASLKSTPQDGDYAMQLTVAGERISVNGKENPNEIGLGIFANEGSFPLSLVPEKFSRLVSARVNCEFSKRDNEVWIKTTRDVKKKDYLHLNTLYKKIPPLDCNFSCICYLLQRAYVLYKRYHHAFPFQ